MLALGIRAYTSDLVLNMSNQCQSQERGTLSCLWRANTGVLSNASHDCMQVPIHDPDVSEACDL